VVVSVADVYKSKPGAEEICPSWT